MACNLEPLERPAGGDRKSEEYKINVSNIHNDPRPAGTTQARALRRLRKGRPSRTVPNRLTLFENLLFSSREKFFSVIGMDALATLVQLRAASDASHSDLRQYMAEHDIKIFAMPDGTLTLAFPGRTIAESSQKREGFQQRLLRAAKDDHALTLIHGDTQ